MPNTMMPANLTCFSETFAKPSKLVDEEMASRVLIRRFRFITRTSSRPVIGRAKTSSRTKPGGANFMAERQSCQAAGVFDSCLLTVSVSSRSGNVRFDQAQRGGMSAAALIPFPALGISSYAPGMERHSLQGPLPDLVPPQTP
ncbi:hypothetical protein TWF970_009107 [Orbilia oligospora]|uniref:Uncharacterized protein n=1 Tax=Orbilia oligospora TaxID=2813651 RepID=A0A7C8R6C3_ORBOL|nr:hypothetical protein TWF970_009107 [Orbilia oligospora]